MPDGETILVVGATGAQGGSVARHLLRGGRFGVRCLTRNPDSERVADLRRLGADIVPGDLDNRATVEAALQGCHGAFGVTNFWEHFDAERRHGRNLIEAVAAAGVRHFVFSTLASAKRASGGELAVPHLDIKAELEEEARGRGLPATFVHVAFYYENFLTFFPPQRQDDGSFAFGFPQGDTPLAAVAAEDIGGVVAPIFDGGDAWLGKTVGVVGDDRPPAEYADAMTRVLGRTVAYRHVPRETYAALGFPGAGELADMFEFNRRFIPERKADLAESRRLYPGIRDFEAWLRANRERFDLILRP